jgi:hypothetical protein
MVPIYPIHIAAEAETLAWKNLAGILERLLPIRFSFAKAPSSEAVGTIVVEGSPAWHAGVPPARLSSLRLPGRESGADGARLVEVAVRFADDPRVPFPYRGRVVRAKAPTEPEVLKLSGTEVALASSERGPVWVVSEAGGLKHFRSGFAVPDVAPGAILKEVLNEERFLELLPLMSWLRERCSGSAYEEPALRACFIFDDPNLHWPRYGRVDFGQLAARAEKGNYHVSFATIPLDTWFTHRATADIFRQSRGRLSLCVHGNNHTRAELAQSYTEAERAGLLVQAVARVQRLERAGDLRVCRVMIPPHGACTGEMLREVPRRGFESACISHGSLLAYNRASGWTQSLGYRPSELVEGCPVLPRWGMTNRGTPNAVLLAAFLGQPIILRGHHQDLRNGIELLDSLAELVNGLGRVCWSDLTGISRSNFQGRLEGSTFWLRPLSRKVAVRLPAAAKQLVLESPGNGEWQSWRILGLHQGEVDARAGEGVPLKEGEGVVCIQVAGGEAVPALRAKGIGLAPRAVLRRFLTEARDRLG